jgi:hypothetical protein
MSVWWTNRFWAASLDLNLFLGFFETFCKYVPRNKLCGSTNFIIFGHTDKKLWVFENLRISMGMQACVGANSCKRGGRLLVSSWSWPTVCRQRAVPPDDPFFF